MEDLEACCTENKEAIEQNTKRHENVDLSFNKLCPLIDEIFDVASPPGSTKYDCCHESYTGTAGQIGNAMLCTSESFLTLSGIYPTTATGTCATTCGSLPSNLVAGGAIPNFMPGGNQTLIEWKFLDLFKLWDVLIILIFNFYICRWRKTFDRKPQGK